jgi:three-Cys-motif partner protein
MSKSVYRQGLDGFPARVSGGWAQDKLDSLSGYYGIFNSAMRLKFPTRCCLDLMAGGGRCVLKRSDVEFDGSPLLALAATPPFSTVVLVESDVRLFEALTARTAADAARTTLIRGDCNDANVITQIRAAVPSSALSVAFADNLGLDVTFDAVRQLTVGRRMDLVITFQVSDIKRNVDRALARPLRGQRWDRFFGTPTWRQAVADFEARRTSDANLGVALENFYAARLATIGYVHRTQLNRSMRNTRNAPLYRVMLFSKHDLAIKLFDASNSAVSSQSSLFG